MPRLLAPRSHSPAFSFSATASISSRLARLPKLLESKVEVVFATVKPGEVRNTQSALDNLDDWLGEGRWDLIHFNFGLGDLVYRAPGMKRFG